MKPGLHIIEVPQLGPWTAQWDELTTFCDPSSPFLRSWWLEGVGGKRDHFVLVVDGETLVGGLALERRPGWGVDRFRTLGGGKLCPDYMDVVTSPARAPEVVEALRGWFVGPGSRVVELEGVCSGAKIVDVLAPAKVTQLDITVYETLPESFEAYMAARSKSFASRVRKFERRSSAGALTYRRVGADEVDWAMAEFSALHSVRDDRVELMREIPRIERAVALGAARDEVRIYVTEHDGDVGVVMIIFTTGNRASIYQTARSMEPTFNHAGTVIDIRAIQDACAEGLTEFDFLRGPEAYKRSFASSTRQLYEVRAAHGIAGRLVLSSVETARRIRRWLGRIRRAARR